MKYLKFTPLLLMFFVSAYAGDTVFNPFTSKPDYIAQPGTGGAVTGNVFKVYTSAHKSELSTSAFTAYTSAHAATTTATYANLTLNSTVGANIVTNGTFTSDLTGWTGTNWAQNSGAAKHTTGSTSALTQAAATVVVGTPYKLTFDITGRTAGTITPSAGGMTGFAYANNDTSIVWYFTATATTALAFTPTSTFDGSLDNVSLQPISQGALAVGQNITGTLSGMPIKLTKTLSLPYTNEIAAKLEYTVNKATSGNATGLLIAATETSAPGTNLGIDYQVGGASKFNVDNVGALTAANQVSTPRIINTTSATLTVSNSSQSGTSNRTAVIMASGTFTTTAAQSTGVSITPTYNQSSGTAANTDLLINRTETALGSGAQRLLDLGTGGGSFASKYNITNKGHVNVNGTAPSLTVCGNSPTISTGSNDHAGTFTIGATGTGCVVTFGTAYTNTPSCNVMAQTMANLTSYTKTNTAITVVGSPGSYDYVCFGLNE